ncbi:MAG: cation-transporting P-type ATPase [Clostridia bacterium]|nr:cation-transporting P-type ATPase [Clostridia bacterium]
MAYSGNEWHLRDAEAVAAALDTDIYKGLDRRVAAKRRRRDGANDIWQVSRTSASEYALRCVGDLTAAVLIIAALTAAIFESNAIAAAVCAILAVGVALRVVTYVKARRTLEEMADEGIPNATVIRNGTSEVVRADRIVTGDVIILEAGDIVPCDGRIVSGDEIRVSERGITDNKSGVIKRNTVIMTDSAGTDVPCEYRVNMLFAGSCLLTGQCRMIATACGDDALVSMRYGGLLIPSGEEIPVMERLGRWCRTGTVIMLISVFLISALSVGVHVVTGRDFSFADAFIDAMALAAASVSSYLVTSGYVTITIPLMRAAKAESGRAIVKDASDIEKVASVKRLIVSDISMFKTGKAEYAYYSTDGTLHKVTRGDAGAERLLRAVHLTTKGSASSSAPVAAGTLSETKGSVIVEKIWESSAEKYGFDKSPDMKRIAVDHAITKNVNGSSDNVIVVTDGRYEAHVSGDVRDVLSFSDRYIKDGRETRLTDRVREEILRTATEAERSGGTVTALAHRDSPYTSLKRISVLQSNMCFDGFIVSDEEAEAGVTDVTARMKRYGMSVILLSSSPVTDSAYLEKAGISKSSVPVFTIGDVAEKSEFPQGSFIVSVPPRRESGGKIEHDAKLRMAAVRFLTDKLSDCAVLTCEPSESGMMAEKTVGVAVSRSYDRPIPQTLKRKAEVSVYPSTGRGYGGFTEAVKAVCASVRSLENLRKCALYSVISGCARLACTLLSVITGIAAVNAASILLLGMIFDFCAMLVISFAPGDGTAGHEESMRQVPDRSEVVKFSLIGAACGAVCYAAAVLAERYFGGGGTIAAGTAALMLSGLVLLSEFLIGNLENEKKERFGTAYVAYAAVCLIFTLLFAVSGGVCGMLGDVRPHPLTVAAAAASAIVIFAAFEVTKYCLRRGKSETN